MNTIELLKQARDALEEMTRHFNQSRLHGSTLADSSVRGNAHKVRDAINQHIKELENVEPRAWLVTSPKHKTPLLQVHKPTSLLSDESAFPLYTHSKVWIVDGTRTEALKHAAQAVVDRWDTPLWKDVPATAIYINKLREVLK